MSAQDIARLERVVEETNQTVKAILRRIEAREEQKKPGLTIVGFAKAAGIGRSTVCRLLRSGKLYRKNGRIPYELLKSYLS